MNDLGQPGAASEAPPVEWKEERWSVLTGLRNGAAFMVALFKKYPVRSIAVTLVVVLSLYAERDLLQPWLLVLRIYAPSFLLVLSLPVALWLFVRKRSARLQVMGGTLGAVAIIAIVFFGVITHDYFAQYFRYESLKITDITTLPVTEFERVLPLNGVHTILRERMNETEDPSVPDLVRVGTGYRWTMAIEPSKPWGRFFDSVHELMSISSTETSPNFDRKNAEQVSFATGEYMLWSKDVFSCVRRSFGPIRSFSYEPGNVLYMKDDAGKWVQVVTLIHWTTSWANPLFPWPEFGGVQVIEQGDTTIFGRLLLGCGTWIPPEDVGNHAFLRAQNLVPFEVSRFMAASLRFQNGFWGPMPFNRSGDLRIADVAQDVNPQPFTLPFRFEFPQQDQTVNTISKLFQYFALEPHDAEKQGLSTSFFVPADGQGEIYRYRHFALGESPFGPTAIADQVRSSRKEFDWSINVPVEVRPYIRDIADSKGVLKRRFEWMVTVVTIKKREDESLPLEFTSGSDPDIAIVDALRGRVVWVDHQHPDKWPQELHDALGSVWASDN